jgi:guanylate kinase
MSWKINNVDMNIVVSAPSGAGKTTIIQRILSEDDRFGFVVSTTTRPKRNDEIDGKNYYYTTFDDFKDKINNDEFIEWAHIYENYYGTTKKEIDRIKSFGKIPLFDVDVQGAKNLKQYRIDAVYIFIIPPSLYVLRDRLRKRKTETEEQIEVRLANVLAELAEYKQYDYIIVNDSIEEACNDFRSIFRTELLKTERNIQKIEKIIGGYAI